MTHYEVLGVAPSASPAAIRAAYVAAARRDHPDFHAGSDAATRAAMETRMRAINEAWSVLGDAAARRAYDASLRDEQRASWSPGRVHPHFTPVDDDPDDRRDPWSDDDDPDDPAAAYDIPIAGAVPPPRWQQLGPVVLLAAGLVVGVLAAATSVRGLAALAFVLLVAAFIGFLLTPMLEVLRSASRSRE